MDETFLSIEKIAKKHMVLTLDNSAMVNLVTEYLKEKYPYIKFGFIRFVIPGERGYISGEPELRIEFSLAPTDATCPKKCYYGGELVTFLSDIVGKELHFCTCDDNEIDLWFKA